MDATHLAFLKAIDQAGGVRALAYAVNRSTANLYALKQRERPCPPGLVLAVEKASGVSRHELRPDIYPIEEQRK